ncbi:ParA family protein, partial [Vibrio parahaemolyticus]|uniref:ParA family protein n=1 Tax=Vibrio parahaemolyticus TaxID=670 RepID=UPI00235E388C
VEVKEELIEQFYSKKQLVGALNISDAQFEEVKKGMIEDGYIFNQNNSNQYQLDRVQAIEFVKRCGVKSFKEIRKEKNISPSVVVVQTAKGGVGKSTTAQGVAIEAALDPIRNMRVCLVDFDPQGTQRVFLSKEAVDAKDDNYISFVDKFQDWMDDDLETRKEKREFYRNELLEDVIIPTSVPALKLIPSVLTDLSFQLYSSAKLHEEGKQFSMSYVRDMIIEPLKDDFDLFVFDLGPSPDMFLMNALYAATDLLMPATGKPIDFRAYEKHLVNLEYVFKEMLPEDWKGLNSIKTIINRATKADKVVWKNVSTILSVSDCLPEIIQESVAFSQSAEDYKPIQLYKTRKASVREAQNSMNRLYQSYIDVVSERFL